MQLFGPAFEASSAATSSMAAWTDQDEVVQELLKKGKLNDSECADLESRYAQMELPRLGCQKLTRGKFKGKTIAQALSESDTYGDWIESHEPHNPHFIGLRMYIAKKSMSQTDPPGQHRIFVSKEAFYQDMAMMQREMRDMRKEIASLRNRIRRLEGEDSSTWERVEAC